MSKEINTRRLVGGFILLILVFISWNAVYAWDVDITADYNYYFIYDHKPTNSFEALEKSNAEALYGKGIFSVMYTIIIGLGVLSFVLMITSLFPKKKIKKIQDNKRICPDCKKNIPFDANYCPYCTKKFEGDVK